MSTAVQIKEEKKQDETKLPARKMNPLQSLQEEMNKLFDEFRHGFPFQQKSSFFLEPLADFTAKVDMKDTEKEVIVTAELPGVNLEDIEIKLEGNALILHGEKNFEKEEKHKNYYRMERSYGSFYRALPLPCAIEKEDISATYKNGILKVTMPKSKDAVENTKKIEVKAG